jgi:hypothetical protein
LESAAGAGHQVGEFGVGDFDLLVDRHEFVDQLGGQLASGLADDVPRPDGVQHSPRLLGGQELLRPARHEFEQQVVQAGDDFGAGAAGVGEP